MVVWKSVARQAAAAMNVTRLITPKSTAIPAGRATNLIQRRGFSNGGDHHGPPKDEFWGLGKNDVKYICIEVGGLMILYLHAKYRIYELSKKSEELSKELEEISKELEERFKGLEKYKKEEEEVEVFH